MQKYLFITLLFLGLGLSKSQAQSPIGVPPVAQLCPLYIPNAFTPNGDGINDQFTLRIGEDCEMVKFSLQIFDRWGRLIFETNSISVDQAWDGKFENNDLSGGVYLFKMQAEMLSYNNSIATPTKVNKQGSIVLIRQ